MTLRQMDDFQLQGFILEYENEGKVIEYNGRVSSRGLRFVLDNEGTLPGVVASRYYLEAPVFVEERLSKKVIRLVGYQLIEIDRVRLLSEGQSVELSEFLARLGAE